MIAIAAPASEPRFRAAPQPIASAAGGSAEDLALAYLRYVSACWRGETSSLFARLLDVCWSEAMPAALAKDPDAFSPHGGGGRGIAWYQGCGEVLGYVPGKRGGYRVPTRTIPRLLASAPAAPQEAPVQRAPRAGNSDAAHEANRAAPVFVAPPWSRHHRRRQARRLGQDSGSPKFGGLSGQEIKTL
jgi:hypothetical protein